MKYILLLIIPIALFNSCGFDCQSYLDNKIKPIKFDGLVIKKQKAQTGCFGIIILNHKSQIDTLKNICYCVPEQQGLWKSISEGDSLHKSENSLVVEIYHKKNMKKIDYPCCGQ